MIFIEALNRASTQTNEKKLISRNKYRPVISNKDSVDLSSAAHQVKEIHLDSQTKKTLTASTSIFANLIEHVLSHIMNSTLHLHSPEELNLDSKEWKIFLQVPPLNTEKINKADDYITPEVPQRPPAKQLIFHIPVKPLYGTPVEMTVLLSPHNGSPETPIFFHTFPKESWLPILHTPYSPEFLNQQITHYHILLDQDGEQDQLSSLHAHINQSKIAENNTQSAIFGLRIWRAKNQVLTPAVLGDSKVGLLFVGHYPPIEGNPITEEERARQANNLYTKA
ncbi:MULTISPECIES: hypothetical protein [Marinomonas]|uniref:Uncharacterized protein n=1 Tax=Marinomonas arctica TaxID=383750 RepID=A0A7H1J3W2_9GAMM|nr:MULTISPECIES: hypothetical protein [Marinomonas]MCS7486947.1 hypothetical protein [Marinomonas sp. BSi20414]QNT05178.1 hypothetical protein IBG28_16000 [Marinomonas arctica]GGN15466.1 hypothetical protein GCM10011350_00390 [Marinomonas arctica]